MIKKLFSKAYQALHGATEVPKVSVAELKKLIDDKSGVVLLDVREPWEFDMCHIHGARLIPMKEIPHRMGELEKTKPIAVYCHSGGRSARVVKYLRQQGFEDVVNVSGGIDAWAEEIDPEMRRY